MNGAGLPEKEAPRAPQGAEAPVQISPELREMLPEPCSLGQETFSHDFHLLALMERTGPICITGFFDSGPKPISLLVSQAPIKQGCSPTGARYFSSQYFFPRAPRMPPEVRERAAGCEESSVGVARPQDTSLLWPSSAFPQVTTPVIKVSS